MPAASSLHPSADQLRRFAQGRLVHEESADVESHVAACDVCCRVLEKVPDDTLVQLAREAATFGFRAEQKKPGAAVADKPAATKPTTDIPAELAGHPRYRILGLVGTGGMGAVYKAEHRLMERLVALKVISPTFLKNAAAVERFQREFKSAARLSHPNVVTAYDAERAGDLHFLVMEFVEGLPLDRLVQQAGPLPIARACHVIHQAALGLAHAHERGMVHRDIKPQNVMVGRKGQVKVLDFGLARLVDSVASSDTTAGMILGTPDYIAPEQAADARAADIRSDIYSLGGTFYFALTGQPPFPKGSFVEKLMQHSTRPPEPITALRPDVPAELAQVLDRMLAKDPAQRFATPADVAKALAPFVRERPAARPESTAATESTAPLAAPALSPDLTPLPDPLANLALAPASNLPPATARGATAALALTRRQLVAALVAAGVVLTILVLAFPLAGWLLPSHGPPPAPPVASSRGPYKALFVLPTYELYRPDYSSTVLALEAAKIKVQLAARTDQPSSLMNFPGVQGPRRNVPYGDNLSADEYDVIIFTGYDTSEFEPDGPAGETTRRLIADFQAQGKPVAAICRGQQVLAAHGQLKGKKAAYCQYVEHPLYDDALQTKSGVEAAGRIVTGAADANAPEFVVKIVELLDAR